MNKKTAHLIFLVIDAFCVYAIWFLFSEVSRINSLIGNSGVIKVLSGGQLLSISIILIVLHALIIIDNITTSEKLQRTILYCGIFICLTFISFSIFYWMQNIWQIESNGYHFCSNSTKSYFRGSIEYYAKHTKDCP